MDCLWFSLLLRLLLLPIVNVASDDYHVILNTARPIHELDERFLSVCINPRIVTAFDGPFNPRDPKLLTLTSALQPAFFRLGGTAADFLMFEEKSGGMDAEWGSLKIKTTNFTLTAEAFDLLNTYVEKSGMQLLFDFNLLLRDGINWSSDNAEKILDYAIRKDYAKNMHFELGNEPNEFPDSVHRNISASQIAKDVHILRQIIRDRIPKCPHFKDAFIVGPDITRPKKKSLNFLNEYIKPAAVVIDYITFHTYYLNLKTAKPEDFTNYKHMDTLAQEIDELRSSVYTAHKIRKAVWLGESGTCLGTTKGIEFCQRYLAGFLWLDKLGLAASMDVKVVIRQVLYDGVDGLLDKHLNIMPDYWLSVLFKKLAGNRVLEVARATSQSYVRFYAHCTNAKLSNYPAGAITYFGVNMLASEVNLTLTEDHMTLMKHFYWLIPGDDKGLVSEYIALNNKVLKMVNSTSLPDMPPSVIGANAAIILPPMSFGFVVIPDANAEACISCM